MRKFLLQRNARARRAFTLLEVVLSLGVVALLMLGAQSAILLATRALPDGRSRNSAIATSNRALDLITSDVMYATSILTNNATELSFLVPDRDGNGTPETIHYLWSGTPGAALTRQLNSGDAVSIAGNVQEFLLTYDQRSEVTQTIQATGSETLLHSYDPASSSGNFAVEANDWVGEVIRPALPGNTVSWQVTRVQFKARTHGPILGSASVQLRTVGGSTPLAILEETTMLENTLTSSYTWQDFSFANVTGLAPTAGIALTIQWLSGVEACDIQYHTSSSTALDARLIWTTSGGSSWNASNSSDMPVYLYGIITTADPAASIERLTNVRCRLRTGSDSAGGLTASIRVLNEPQVTAP